MENHGGGSAKKPMDNWAKAYILGLVLLGVGMLGARMAPDSFLLEASSLAALICGIIGTTWLVSAVARKRKSR